MSLPGLYGRWVRAALGRDLPEEQAPTCLSCVMVAGEGDHGRPREVACFDRGTKCCTYLPDLPNFQVGRLLDDPNPALAEGRASVRARIAAGVAVTPMGVGWPAAFDAAYEAFKDTRFGRMPEARCPHYLDRDGGLCGLWVHRNAVCSTWFCRHDRGLVGRRLWMEAESVLRAVEEVLSAWVLTEAGLSPEAAAIIHDRSNPANALDGSVPVTEALRREAWGAWFGREEAFYVEAGRRVGALSWADVAALGGQRVRAGMASLGDALEDVVAPGRAPFVRGGKVKELHRADGRAWVYAYRVFDAHEVPVAAVEALRALPPMPTEEAEARLAAAIGGPVEPATLRAWIDARLLEPCLP